MEKQIIAILMYLPGLGANIFSTIRMSMAPLFSMGRDIKKTS